MESIAAGAPSGADFFVPTVDGGPIGAGWLALPSGMPGFLQAGAPIEWSLARDFGTTGKPCRRSVAVLDVPGADVGDCAGCGFKAAGHMLTLPLLAFMRGLLEMGQTLKAVSLMTGVGKNVVKEVDEARLEPPHTEDGPDGERRPRRPERQSRHVGTDEFKLHDGHRCATVVTDLEDGRVPWLAHTRRKQVVRDFCEHVGERWMRGVAAVACDTSADFASALLELHPHPSVVYDRFHLVRNFNEKVVSEVRKAEQGRLAEEGDKEAAGALKNNRYILMARRSTLRGMGAAPSRGGGEALFARPEPRAAGGPSPRERHEALMSQNELLAACDVVKELLEKACSYRQEKRMRDKMAEVVEVCRGTGDPRFGWFAKLVESHMGGICAHARHGISSGRVEGTNNTIKTLRRAGYGYPDDDYFFLKIFDAARRYAPGRESLAA